MKSSIVVLTTGLTAIVAASPAGIRMHNSPDAIAAGCPTGTPTVQSPRSVKGEYEDCVYRCKVQEIINDPPKLPVYCEKLCREGGGSQESFGELPSTPDQQLNARDSDDEDEVGCHKNCPRPTKTFRAHTTRKTIKSNTAYVEVKTKVHTQWVTPTKRAEIEAAATAEADAGVIDAARDGKPKPSSGGCNRKSTKTFRAHTTRKTIKSNTAYVEVKTQVHTQWVTPTKRAEVEVVATSAV